MRVSDQIRKLAQLMPLHEEKLDLIMGPPLIHEDKFEHNGREFFWRPKDTEVQESHGLHLEGVSSPEQADLQIETIETLPEYETLGNLAQDVIVRDGVLGPDSTPVPDLE